MANKTEHKIRNEKNVKAILKKYVNDDCSLSLSFSGSRFEWKTYTIRFYLFAVESRLAFDFNI